MKNKGGFVPPTQEKTGADQRRALAPAMLAVSWSGCPRPVRENCSVSVDPSSAVVDALPPAMVCCSSSK